MTGISLQHIRQHGPGNIHRGHGVDVHRLDNLCMGLLVEGLVARDNSCAVDKDIDWTAVFDGLPVCEFDNLHVSHIYLISLDLAELGEFLSGLLDTGKVNIPDYEAFRSFLKGHATHDLADSGCTSGDQHVCIFKFHNHCQLISGSKDMSIKMPSAICRRQCRKSCRFVVNIRNLW